MSALVEASRWLATLLAYLATGYVAVYQTLNLTMILLAWAELRRQRRYRTREAAGHLLHGDARNVSAFVQGLARARKRRQKTERTRERAEGLLPGLNG